MPDIFQDSSRYFHISAFYALSLPYYHMEHHTHSSYEIMYITSGSCRVFCLDGTQDTEFPLKSGQFIFIRPDVPHRLEIPDGFPCSILNLEFSLTPEKSPVALELLLKKDPGFSQFWNFMEASQGFCSGADSRSFGYSLKDLLTFLQQNSGQIQKEEFLFFLLFSRMLTELAFCARSSRSPQGIVYLKKALRYIDEHYLEDIDIPAISAYAGINKSYLQALFTEKNGCTHQYLYQPQAYGTGRLSSVQQYSAHYGYCLFFRIQQPAAFCTYLRKILSYEPLQVPKPSYPASPFGYPKETLSYD